MQKGFTQDGEEGTDYKEIV